MDSLFKTRVAIAIEHLSVDLKLSVRAAALKYNVSARTLSRRLQDGLSRQKARSSQQLLSSKQEDRLVK